jgi:glutamyl-Q tRNA(Asp) synthetase
MNQTVTRFAPSPTGLLHLGHAYSALFAEKAARAEGGRFLLRIEDIDRGRCRLEFESAIEEDLLWLGLKWDGPVIRQSDRFDLYRQALTDLSERNLIYPCFCTRKEIQAEISASDNAPHGPDGPIYPGTCRTRSADERQKKIDGGEPYALRLDVAKASAEVGTLTFYDQQRGEIPVDAAIGGDVVLSRKDTPASYHLAVTTDDSAQGVTLVTRGEDLLAATHIHRLLQTLLNYPEPAYHHHALLKDENGKRLAKRDRSLTLRALRQAGHTSQYVHEMIEGYFSK